MKKLLALVLAGAVLFMMKASADANVITKTETKQEIKIGADKYTFQDFINVKWIKEPVLSPDGKSILFTAEQKNLEKNTAFSKICILNTETGKIKAITPEDQKSTSGRWSPDGKKIAFVKVDKGNAEIWTMDTTGKNAKKLTDTAYGASGPVWSPNGDKILFASEVYADCKTMQDNKVRKNAKEKSKVKARIIEELPYQVFDRYREDRFSHLFIINTDGTGLKDLTPGKYDCPPIDLGTDCDYSFSPDGKEVCYVTNTDENLACSTNNDLFIYNLETGNRKRITESKANDSGCIYSPDGKYIAYTAMERPGFEADRRVLTLYERETGKHIKISDDFDRSVLSFRWLPNSKSLVCNADNDGFTCIYNIDINGNVKKLSDNNTDDSPFASADGKTVYYRSHRTTHPPVIKSVSLENSDSTKVVADINKDFAKFKMNEPEHFHFKASDGQEVQGFIVKPYNYIEGKKYGLIYLIHGGPQSSWTDDFHQRWNTQLFASKGYAVATVNFRGSTGWGQKFTDEISGNWGGRPYEDLMEGLDYIIDTYTFVDKDRMAAVGASYGGYMVDWIMGHTDRFKCAVSLSGVFNTLSEYGTTEELWFDEWEMKGTPYNNRESYEKWNPFNFVNNFKTPCLVIHGDEDYRVPVSESKQLFTALKRNGVPAKFLNFPDECHFIRKPQNMQLWYSTMDDWFKTWLKEK